VFDGAGDAQWYEGDATGPLSVYGQTKLEAEQLIEGVGGNYLIFRTSWVYAARGRNFAKTMIKLAKEREELQVIDDQIGAPTGAELIADVTAHAIRQAVSEDVSGIYHLTAGGEVSWHGYASFVLDYCRQSGVDIKVVPDAVLPVPTASYSTAAERPLNSRLNTNKLQETFKIDIPHWHDGVVHMLDEILER
jgi:dTDP-4-dehydrorhamnose reductase